MTYAYIIRGLPDSSKRYFGITSDLKVRLKDHNAGRSLHTAKYGPWRLETYIASADRQKAIMFLRDT
jgi:putative endonuclease